MRSVVPTLRRCGSAGPASQASQARRARSPSALLSARQAPQAAAASALVSESCVEAFQRDGVVHLPGAFGPAWLATLRGAFGEAMAHPGPQAEFIGKGVTRGNLFDAGNRSLDLEMFQDQLFFKDTEVRAPAWADIVRDSPAAGIIAALMQSTTVTFFYNHLILKRGGAERPIPWHQDLPYWKIDGRQIASVWIALDDMPESASVRYVRGSHRWGLFRPRHFVDAAPYEGRDELPFMPDIDAMIQRGEAEAVAFAARAGDAVCFDARLVHGSPGNHGAPGEDHRRAALRFGGDDATYCDRAGETAIPTPEVDAAHGLRHGDHLACATFPRVWPPPVRQGW